MVDCRGFTCKQCHEPITDETYKHWGMTLADVPNSEELIRRLGITASSGLRDPETETYEEWLKDHSDPIEEEER